MTPTPAIPPHSVGLLAMAKEPVPGRVKTRLCPPCTPRQAAMLAAACLADTTAALAEVVARGGAGWWGVALDGRPGPWLAPGGRTLPQPAGSFDFRLGAAAAGAGGPVVIVGADTPQAGADDLAAAVDALCSPGTDAVLGRAPDGGYWVIGLRQPGPELFHGVPMSREDTADHQLRRLAELGLATRLVPEMVDVDTMADAEAVADLAPGTRFARALEPIRDGLRSTGSHRR